MAYRINGIARGDAEQHFRELLSTEEPEPVDDDGALISESTIETMALVALRKKGVFSPDEVTLFKARTAAKAEYERQVAEAMATATPKGA
jgi:hypothetical protein